MIETDENSIEYNHEDIPEIIWEELLGWLNGQDALPVEVKDLFIERSHELRLKFQAVFIEIQRKVLHEVALDVDFQSEIRRSIRRSLPYLDAKEKNDALKTLQTTSEDHLKRLEAQMAGFDFFTTVEGAIQGLSDVTVSKSLKNAVKALPSDRRQKLLETISSIVEDINQEIEIIPEGVNAEPNITE